jgi:hypothetical protein
MIDAKFTVGRFGPPMDTFTALLPASMSVIQTDIPLILAHLSGFPQKVEEEVLYRVLTAYANLDQDLGYRQGMGLFAAIFLMYMSERLAFCAFFGVMFGKVHWVRQYHLDNFALLIRVNRVWDLMLEEACPNVAKNFRYNDIESIEYTKRWFLTAFQELDFAPLVRLRVFDLYMGNGIRALFAFGLAIIRTERRELRIGSRDVIMAILLEPSRRPRLNDCKKIFERCDAHWISQHRMSSAFKRAGVDALP